MAKDYTRVKEKYKQKSSERRRVISGERALDFEQDDEMHEVFSRLFADGKKKQARSSDYGHHVKMEEQVNWYKVLKDSRMVNPNRNLTDLVIKLSMRQIREDQMRKRED